MAARLPGLPGPLHREPAGGRLAFHYVEELRKDSSPHGRLPGRLPAPDPLSLPAGINPMGATPRGVVQGCNTTCNTPPPPRDARGSVEGGSLPSPPPATLYGGVLSGQDRLTTEEHERCAIRSLQHSGPIFCNTRGSVCVASACGTGFDTFRPSGPLRRRPRGRDLEAAIKGIITITRIGSSVADPERGAVLGSAVPSVVEPGGADVGVAEPVLDACNVGLVLEGVGGGGGP